MKKGFVGILVAVLLATGTISSSAFQRWHINLGGAYGIENFSLDKPNEFIREFNKWTLNVSGSDLGMEPIGDNFTSYSVDCRVDLNPRWRVGTNFSYVPIRERYGNICSYNDLPDGGWSSLSVDAEMRINLAIAGSVFYYNLNPGRRFTPFINAGVNSYHLELNGNYYLWEDTFTSSGDWDYKTLSETISVSDSGVGYTVGAGVNWRVLVWHFDLDVGLGANYNFAPKLNGTVTVDENKGFSSPPVPPGPFTIDLSGSEYKVWVGVRF